MIRSGITSLFTTADKILFIFSFVAIISSYSYFWQSTPANYAIVKSSQQDPLLINLDEAKVHQIKGSLGISTLEVKDGKIRFTTSPCRNKICIQSGWHNHGGDVTACLPNLISVQLSSKQSKANYDAIIF